MLFRFTYTSGFGCVKIAVLSATGMLCCLLIILLFNTPPAYYHQVTGVRVDAGALHSLHARASSKKGLEWSAADTGRQ